MWPLTKHHEGTQIFKETGDLKQIHQIKLVKTWFSHDGVCATGRDLAKRIIPDKILKYSVSEIVINPNYYG